MSPRRRARAATGWAVAAYLIAIGAAFAALDVVRPDLRDGEYGRRLASLRARVRENPGRDLVVVIGSSRAAMDVCPRAWEEVRSPHGRDPLVFNMARVGAGPILNLMTLRRLYADGIRPAAVLLEYWPPLLREDGAFREVNRIEPEKLYDCDRDFIRAYHPYPDHVEHRMLAVRLNPMSEQRTVLLREGAPSWLPRTKRIDAAVQPLDGWGWLPGMDRPALEWESRDARLAHCAAIYRPQLANLKVDDEADRAIREAVALAREHGTAVGFVYLPESTEFRTWYTPDAERLGQDHLARVRSELAVPLLDARSWLPDESLADGFHATRAGAEEFSRRFCPAAVQLFRGCATQR